MNTRQMEYIIAIAEEKNMHRASERLFVSQSTLSQTLIKLEKELGCQLFFRTSRELTLTPEGNLYVTGARQILDIKEKTYQQIHILRHEAKRTYRVGISFHEGIERFLIASGKLKQRWDHIEIFAIESKYKDLVQKLQDKKLDIIIATWNHLHDLTVPYKVLNEEEILLVTPKGKFGKEAVTDQGIGWDMLREERLILTPLGTTLRNMTDSMFGKLDFAPKVVCEINSVTATLRMVEQQQGLAFLPKVLCEEEGSVDCFSMFPKLIRYQIIAYHEEAGRDEVLQGFIQLLDQYTSGSR